MHWINRLRAFVLLCCAAAVCLAHAAPPAAETADKRFPIIAWSGVPEGHTSLERYKELADCGFTHSFSSFSNVDTVTRALDVAKQVNVRLLVNLPPLQSDPEGTVKKLKSHPALGGYYLRDEPSAADFAELGAWVKRIRDVDPDHPCVINLFPTYATPGQLGAANYQEHVNRFVKEVPVPLISFDHYPVVGKQVRGDWHQNLDIIRSSSAAAGKPFWAFCLSVAHNPYPIPTIEHLRLQANTNLAYGAQGIQYFTYWTPGDTSTWNFHEGPIAAEGKRTGTYDVVKRANAEIQSLAPIFVGSQVTSVGHLGDPLPAGAKPYKPAGPIRAIEVDGPGVVVSSLTGNDRRYLVIVNRDLEKPTVVKVAADVPAKVEAVTKPPGAAGAHPLSTRLEPGGIHVLQWVAE